MSHRMIAGVFAIAFLVGACARSDGNGKSATAGAPTLETYKLPVDTLAGDTWATAPLLNLPTGVLATRDYVAVVDVSTDSLVIQFDGSTGRFVGARANRRLSDGRLFYPYSVELSSDTTGGIRIFDAAMQAVVEYRLSGERAGPTVTAFRDSLSISQPIHLEDGRFLSTALRIEGRLGLFNGDGTLIRSLGDTPGPLDTLPVFIRQHAYRSKGVVHPSQSRVALLTMYADQLEIFDTAGFRLPLQDRPFGFDPAYNVGLRQGAPAVAMIPSSRIGYVAVAADSQHIYGLFSGRSIGSWASSAYFAAHVHVFDWSGKLERVIRLPHAGNFIAVSPDGKRLYVASTGEEPALRMYPLDAPRTLAADVESPR